ncbi:lactonase family protein [Hydrogenophaga laconesensis]|uniref:6-phosphogluconolactonase (Cycloisomerase 2 family) n=1 Tax=Hydrogenophaga laconesensis TaxID=1805971 RepID=A0ABU1VGK6_9BURK|nr:beta-propeller fold lactonase family protein [Hydrogenophaga laconesensis]MDR7096606.1 6-phosphogluconolactonase (cycloisomerase 2 family) [Hydrogenophaga laconesensis]
MPTTIAPRFVRRSLPALALGASLMLLTACGGSSHSDAPTTSTPPAPVVTPTPVIPPAPGTPPVTPAVTHTVGGTVSGLGSGQLILQNNGADALNITANGAFTFATSVADQATYNVTLFTQPPGHVCSIANGSGTIASANVTNVAVSCVATAAVSWVYIPDYGNDRVLGYRIDRTTGARTDLPGSPYPAGDNNRWIAKTPDHRFIYTTNLASNTVSGYSVNATTGELTALPGGPVATGTGPMSMEISPDGRFGYVANSQGSSVSAYSIDATTGVLTEVAGSPFAAGNIPTKIAITPDSHHLYVTNQNGMDVSGFSINTATGALTPVAGSPWTNGGQGYGIAMHPSGDFLYVTGWQARLNVYRIDPTTGALTDLMPGGYTTASSTWEWKSFTTNGAGTVGYLGTNQGIRLYDIDTASGALTEQASQPNNIRTEYVTTNASGTRLYSSDFHTITFHIADIDAGNGSLTATPGSPFYVGARPYNLVVIEP